MTTLHWVIVAQWVLGWAGAIAWRNRGYQRGVIRGLKAAKLIARSAVANAPTACPYCGNAEHLIGAAICKLMGTR